MPVPKETQESLNKTYQNRDPWNYQKNPDDLKRKEIIIDRLKPYGVFDRAFDIGAGEGWITGDLPAEEIYGYDISDVAMLRFPANVIPLQKEEIAGTFDLVIATGLIYPQYDYIWIIQTIKKCASKIILTCHLTVYEHPDIDFLGKPIHIEEFDYFNQYQQRERLRIYDVNNNRP